MPLSNAGISAKTYSAKPSQIEKKWVLIDAENVVLGRMASLISRILRGKHKPTFTPHMDCGDHVVVVNAAKLHLTGKKLNEKFYHRHTGYPGGIKSVTASTLLSGSHPERVLTEAVRRMLGRGPLSRQRLSNLKVYAGSDHPHAAQKPEKLDIAAMNTKNTPSTKAAKK